MVYIYIYQWKDLKTIVDISSPSPLQERFFSQVCDAAELLELTFGSPNRLKWNRQVLFQPGMPWLINMDQWYVTLCWNTLATYNPMLWIGTKKWSDNHKYLLISTWTHHEFRIPVCWNPCWRFTGYMAADHCAVKFSEKHIMTPKTSMDFPLNVKKTFGLSFFRNKYRSFFFGFSRL